jgi:hypothetical protein
MLATPLFEVWKSTVANVCDSGNANMKFSWNIVTKQLQQIANEKWNCFEFDRQDMERKLRRTTNCNDISIDEVEYSYQRFYYPFGYSITTTDNCNCLDYNGSNAYLNANCHLDLNQQWFYDSYWGQISNLFDGKCLYMDDSTFSFMFKPCEYYALDEYSTWTWDETTKDIRNKAFNAYCLAASNDGIKLSRVGDGPCTQFRFNKLWIREEPNDDASAQCMNDDLLITDKSIGSSIPVEAEDSNNFMTDPAPNNDNTNNDSTIQRWPLLLNDTSAPPGWTTGTQTEWRPISPSDTEETMNPGTLGTNTTSTPPGGGVWTVSTPPGSSDATATAAQDYDDDDDEGDDDDNSHFGKGEGKGKGKEKVRGKGNRR